MDPALLMEIAEKNPQDVAAIEQQLGGIVGVLKLLPHLTAIYATVQAYQAKKATPSQKT